MPNNTLLYGATPMPSAGGVSTSNSVMPMARPTVGTVSSALAYGGGGYGRGGGGGGQSQISPSFGMGEHFNQRYDKYANEGRGAWVPVTIDARPGQQASPEAPGGYGMGQVQKLPDPLADVGGTNAKARTQPQGAVPAYGQPAPPIPYLAYGGGGVHQAIVGDPQADGGPNPEMVTSASPIHVRPLRGGKMPNVPMMANGGVDTDSTNWVTQHPSGVSNFSPDYASQQPVIAATQQITQALQNGGLSPQQHSTFLNRLQHGEDTAAVLDQAHQAYQAGMDTLRVNQGQQARNPTVYDNYERATGEAKTAIASGHGGDYLYPQTQDDSGDNAIGRGGDGGGESETAIGPPPQAQSDSGYSFPAPLGADTNIFQPTLYGSPSGEQSSPRVPMPSGTAYQASEDVRRAGFHPEPPGGQGNVNVPPAPQGVGLIPEANLPPNVYDEFKKLENPATRRQEMGRFIKSNPMFIPKMEAEMRATAAKQNVEAEKFNATLEQKHQETIRKIAQNVAQQHHWDNTIGQRASIEDFKEREAKQKGLQKEADEHKKMGGALGLLNAHKAALHQQDPLYNQKLASLDQILNSAQTADAINKGIAYHESLFPDEHTIGGKKAVSTSRSFQFVPGQGGAPKIKDLEAQREIFWGHK
jgi:hypothetical protein